MQMIGYYGVDDAPSDGDVWLRTADVGHLDDDGDLWITDRAAAIIRGGGNRPGRRGHALSGITGVVEAAVFEVPIPTSARRSWRCSLWRMNSRPMTAFVGCAGEWPLTRCRAVANRAPTVPDGAARLQEGCRSLPLR
jgi:acyl-CoA synthetase (AMP-forming)/AMP-acid ligase II